MKAELIYKRICEDCGTEALDGRNRCRTNLCNGFIVVVKVQPPKDHTER
jgi:hypothetical protein